MVETENPINFSKLLVLKIIFFFSVFIFPAIFIFDIFPPQISVINLAANSRPSCIEFKSTPLSNLNFASVIMFSSFEVFAIWIGSNAAASKTIFLVSKFIELDFPPIIPPSPRILLSSVIKHDPSVTLYCLSSKASKTSFLLADLTIIFLSILSASYACIGLLRSSIT